MIGTTLGAYKILDKIGSGGFAQVYLARDMRTNEVVALKVLRTEYTEDQEFISRFHREAESLLKLPPNPHIVALHEFGGQDNTYYIAMEYLEGHDLQDVIQRRGALPVDVAVSITAQVAEALDVALRGGVLHRDVKPANIKISPEGVAKIMDFGIARAAEGTRMTRTGIFVGTPAYVAPEIWEGQPASPQSDVYALGVMLYEMLLGKAPFEATTPAATMRRHLTEPPPPLSSVRPDAPRWLGEVAERALAKDPARRYRDAGQLLAALGAHGPTQPRVDVKALGVASLPSARPAYTPPPTPVPSEPTRRSTADQSSRPIARPAPPPRSSDRAMKTVLAIAGLVGVILIGLIVFAVMRGGGKPTPFAPAAYSTDTPGPAQFTSTPVVVVVVVSPTPGLTPPTDTPPPAPTSRPTASATPVPTASQTPTRGTPPPTSTRGPSATPLPTRAVATTQPGMLFDFENAVNWRRGDQPNGTLTQSTQQAHSGQSSAKLEYNFPTGGNDFVVFINQVTLSGQPNAIGAWVYGDGSGHFLNAWIKDSGGQVWQTSLGRVGGAGWRQMAGYIMTGQAWPWAHISGPDNGQVDYPIQFYALVLDDALDTYSGSGTIYIDDISIWRTDRMPTPAATQPSGPTAPAATPTGPGGAPTVANEPRGVILISPINGTNFRSSVISFEWSGGALQPGETFLVEIIPREANKSGCTEDYGRSGRQYSPPLTEHTWTSDINADRGPSVALPCPGRIEWVVHVKDAAGNVIQTTPRSYFEWNPL